MTCARIHRIIIGKFEEKNTLIPIVLPVGHIRMESFDESLIKLFLTPIRLRMICRRQLDLGTQQKKDLAPKLTNKLRTIITQQNLRHALMSKHRLKKNEGPILDTASLVTRGDESTLRQAIRKSNNTVVTILGSGKSRQQIQRHNLESADRNVMRMSYVPRRNIKTLFR